ncbi:MAG TPA: hypothetical protein VL068_12185, partial [Microthrixaceae bacterium]|nr:hypothetical protein [Microthrixaceae bacterium]
LAGAVALAICFTLVGFGANIALALALALALAMAGSGSVPGDVNVIATAAAIVSGAGVSDRTVWAVGVSAPAGAV